MKKLVMSVGILSGVLGLSGVSHSATESPADLVKQTCGKCHTMERILSKSKTKTGWTKIVDRMINKMNSQNPEIKVSQENAQQIVEYLYEQHGYTDTKTGTLKAEERKKELREKFPAAEPRTVSPKAKTVE